MTIKTRRPRTHKPAGYLLYSGPSKLDGSPIVVVATLKTSNKKTGDMIQIWILPNPDHSGNPIKALRDGHNFGICGDCGLQGEWNGKKFVGRSCYVDLGKAPRAVAGGVGRGIYSQWIGTDYSPWLGGRKLRLGAYGDPAAIPDDILFALVRDCAGHTGYSHQLLGLHVSRERQDLLATILMASCENKAQYAEAKRRGYRAFFVAGTHDAAPQPSVECPAYTHSRSCADCMLCQGTNKSARDVYVIAHGLGAANLK